MLVTGAHPCGDGTRGEPLRSNLRLGYHLEVTLPVETRHAEALVSWLAARRRVFALTGAGCSTESGIPDYRDENGDWKHKQPVTFQEFVGSESVRKRYWARSRVGWQRIRSALPNAAHSALSELERLGVIAGLVTQNVDGLHQRAGSRNVIELHGGLDEVECTKCRCRLSRDAYQQKLDQHNPSFAFDEVHFVPDGDAELLGADYEQFVVPPCDRCGGVLKPAVVFFGESVPRLRMDAAMAGVDESDGLLVVGSSLMVFSGFRCVRRAFERSVPVAIVNLGRTRADERAALCIGAPCGSVLPTAVRVLRAGFFPNPALP